MVDKDNTKTVVSTRSVKVMIKEVSAHIVAGVTVVARMVRRAVKARRSRVREESLSVSGPRRVRVVVRKQGTANPHLHLARQKVETVVPLLQRLPLLRGMARRACRRVCLNGLHSI